MMGKVQPIPTYDVLFIIVYVGLDGSNIMSSSLSYTR